MENLYLNKILHTSWLLFESIIIYLFIFIIAISFFFPGYPDGAFKLLMTMIINLILIFFIIYRLIKSKQRILLLIVIVCSIMGCKISYFIIDSDIGQSNVKMVPPLTNFNQVQYPYWTNFKEIKDFRDLMPSGLTLFQVASSSGGSSGSTHAVILESAQIKKDGSFEPIDWIGYICNTVGSSCIDHITSLHIIPFQNRQFWLYRIYNYPPSGLPSYPTSKTFRVNDQGKFVEDEYGYLWAYISWLTHMSPIFLFLLLKKRKTLAISISVFTILLWTFAFF